MSTTSRRYPEKSYRQDLENGDRLSQKEFHGIYKSMPTEFRAELIGGIVHVPSPLKQPHGDCHSHLGAIFAAYKGHTPGVQVCDNTTVILSDEDEVQPDLFLRVLPSWGGQTRDTVDEYVRGAPELIAEIAHSSRAIDLHAKRDRYVAAGVREYIVVSLAQKQIHWFQFQCRKTIDCDPDGVLRSVVFPGLWVHHDALLQSNYNQIMDVLNQGIMSPEHTAFKQHLQMARHG